LVGTERFDICVSVPLMLEYEDVLKRQLNETGLVNAQVGDILDYLCSVAIKQEVFYLWRPTLRDPKDDLVLELAVAGRCPDVITFNQKDFAGSERFGVKARRPHEFLAEIGEL
jgi:predicted nucleic acid-binding protein